MYFKPLIKKRLLQGVVHTNVAEGFIYHSVPPPPPRPSSPSTCPYTQRPLTTNPTPAVGSIVDNVVDAVAIDAKSLEPNKTQLGTNNDLTPDEQEYYAEQLAKRRRYKIRTKIEKVRWFKKREIRFCQMCLSWMDIEYY